MEIQQIPHERGLSLKLNGRLDAYWASHLGKELEGAIRQGNDRIILDFQEIEFLSSAGIGVLLKYYKILQSMKGSLSVVRPIPLVRNVFDLSGLTQVLLRDDAQPASAVPEAREKQRVVERSGARFEMYDLQSSASLSCRILGEPIDTLAAPAPGDDCFHVTFPADAFGVGVGALGRSYEDCRDRFGEFLSFGGATFYLPANGTNVPDYDIVRKNFLPEVYVLNGLACRGSFSHFLRFDTMEKQSSVPASALMEMAFEQSAGAACGFVMLAETQGLVGAWLRRSPVAAGDTGPFFEHPALRDRLSFSAEPVFAHHLTWVTGVLATRGNAALDALLRPIADGHELCGHMHALAMSYRHIPKGKLDFQETFSGMFDALDSDILRGLLHLVNDDRPVIGRGESEFVRGVCWTAPIRSFGS